MKKLFYFVFVLFFVLPNISFATSGACSSHGGVNCRLESYEGKVVCNDGWVNSSVLFSENMECSELDSCPAYVSDKNYTGLLLSYEKDISDAKVRQNETCSNYDQIELLIEKKYNSCINLMNANTNAGKFSEAIDNHCLSDKWAAINENQQKKEECVDGSNSFIAKMQKMYECLRPESEMPKLQKMPTQEEIDKTIADAIAEVKAEQESEKKEPVDSIRRHGLLIESESASGQLEQKNVNTKINKAIFSGHAPTTTEQGKNLFEPKNQQIKPRSTWWTKISNWFKFW